MSFTVDGEKKEVHLHAGGGPVELVVRWIRGDSDYYSPAGIYEGTVVYGKHSRYILYFTPDDPDQMPDAP